MSDPIRINYQVIGAVSDELQARLVALNLPGYLGLAISGNTVQVLITTALIASDKARLDASMSSYVPDPTTWARTLQRGQANTALSDIAPLSTVVRAVVLAILSELNRARIADGLSPLTAQQVRTAIMNQINSGAADS